MTLRIHILYMTALVVVCAANAEAAAAPIASPKALTVVAKSQKAIWNAVAVDGRRVFLAGPRWTGSKGPALSVASDGGAPAAYPDARWNGWSKGADPANAFVNINSIHTDGHGGLWVVDTGAPDFGGDPLPGGAKLVRIDLVHDRVDRVIPLGPDVALRGSYVDDIRFNGDHAYLTDAGRGGLIVLELKTGHARRVLNDHPSTLAPKGRSIMVDGHRVDTPDGQPLRVNADPMELTPDHRWLVYGPLSGPGSRVPTSLLDDPTVSPRQLAAAVQPWADLPPTGGTAMASDGTLYFSDLATDALRKRAPDGAVSTVIADPRLHWVDALFLDANGVLWLPVPQMDRVGLFNGGHSKVQPPVRVYRLQLPAKTEAQP